MQEGRHDHYQHGPNRYITLVEAQALDPGPTLTSSEAPEILRAKAFFNESLVSYQVNYKQFERFYIC